MHPDPDQPDPEIRQKAERDKRLLIALTIGLIALPLILGAMRLLGLV